MAAIIFDFDGTIADSFDYVAGFLAKGTSMPIMSADVVEQLRGMSMQAMARSLGYPWWRLPGLFLRGRQEMTRVISRLKPFDGIPKVLEELHAEGHELFIVSSNSVRNVRRFLHKQELHKYFLEIDGNVGLFGKAGALRRLARSNHFEIKECVYIGDEVRDVSAAKSIGMRVIAVSWGFARTQSLVDMEPTALAEEPQDIVRILEEL